MKLTTIRTWDKARLLNRFGLQETPSTAATIVRVVELVGLGAMVGFGVGLLMAPSTGRKIRGEWGYRLTNVKERIRNRSADPFDDTQLAGA